MQDCPQRSKLTMIGKEEGELDSEAFRLGMMILNSTKAKNGCKQKELMFANINIANQRSSALINIRASDLFVLESYG